MTGKKRTPETAMLEVVVNHDDLRRGERGEVELTDAVRARLDRGFLKLVDLGEVWDDNTVLRPLGSTAGRPGGGGVLLGVDAWGGGGGGDSRGTVPAEPGPGTD